MKRIQRNARIEKGYSPQPRRVPLQKNTGFRVTPIPPTVNTRVVAQPPAPVYEPLNIPIPRPPPPEPIFTREVVMRSEPTPMPTYTPLPPQSEPKLENPVPTFSEIPTIVTSLGAATSGSIDDDAKSVDSRAESIVSVTVDNKDSTKPKTARKPRKKKDPPASLKSTVLNIP